MVKEVKDCYARRDARMKHIHQLSPHVANLIAAGEVVERPSSVIKELVENALDAGANSITVEIEKGGLTYMRVTDNGTGMALEDASTAFLRHATSKLSSGRDLEAIETLGFRGEALAAIAAVSRIDLFTRTQEETQGVSLSLEGGKETETTAIGTPLGTTIIVRDLFFNTPARLKFMKSDRAEAAAITALMTAIAISHPEVSFRYLRDNKEEFHTPGDNSIHSTIYMLLGRNFAKDLIELSETHNDIGVNGFITAPALSRGNRSHQYFYVNGRLVRSKLLQAALEQAYKNVQFTGRFPACVLYLNLGHHLVDVNVHPTKTEVKFLYEKQVFDAVYYGVLSALKGNRYIPELRLPQVQAENPAPATSPTQTSSPPTQTPQVKTQVPTPTNAPPPAPVKPVSLFPNIPFDESLFKNHTPAIKETPPTPTPAPSPKATETFIDQAPYRLIGEALDTYILVEQEDALYFIDKHAAHERILFDKLKATDYKPMPQTLLEPITLHLGAQVVALLSDHAHLLSPFGFSYNQFSSDSLAIRSFPADLLEIAELEHFLSEIAGEIGLGKSPSLDKIHDKVLHVLSCKGAIKAGKRSDPLELSHLAQLVLSGTVQYCPHGRPVFLRLGKGQLDRQVRR